MKTMKRMITVISILMSIQVFALSDIQIRANGNTEVIIEAEKNTGDESIKIFDEERNLLFFEKINQDKYLKTFALSTLPAGKYFVQYENQNKISIAVIVKNDNSNLLTSNFSQISFKPMIKQNGDFLSVGLTNPQLKEVSIVIYDMSGFELTEIKNLNGISVKKTFNTNKLPSGEYRVKVECGDESFSKLVEIK